MHQEINDLMALFEGYKLAYGAYKLTGKVEGGKVLGKAYTLKGPMTVELWHQHLTGRQGLGVVPINENNEVRFGAIDVDQYPLDLRKLAAEVAELRLPLIVCRTKSGGAHLYLMLQRYAPAAQIQEQLRVFAAMLGFGGSEIFPKQTKVIAERGDMGQWINMPYFLASRTDRYAVHPNGTHLELRPFIEYCKQMLADPDTLAGLAKAPEETLEGGPPCLNQLIKNGFPDGTRNNGLLNLGVYAKKVDPDNWRRLLEQYNQEYMDPPLNAIEVLGVIRSLGKKEFNYMCHQAPIQQHCNRELCRQCKHGIGGYQVGMPRFGTLTKLCTEPPIWFLEVDGGGRLELRTEDLQNPMYFQKACMMALNIMPGLPKRETWTETVQRLMSDVNIIEMPREATPLGLLIQHLEDFCTSRVQGKTHDELLLGKPWTNNKRHYFRMRDFLAYLERQKFREFSVSYIAMHLRDLGSEKVFFNVRGKGVNAYSIPEFNNKQTDPLAVPDQGGKKPFE